MDFSSTTLDFDAWQHHMDTTGHFVGGGGGGGCSFLMLNQIPPKKVGVMRWNFGGGGGRHKGRARGWLFVVSC